MAFRNTREQGAVGKYDARTFGVYQNVDDSGKWGVAYCIDQHKDGPLASVGYAAYGKPELPDGPWLSQCDDDMRQGLLAGGGAGRDPDGDMAVLWR